MRKPNNSTKWREAAEWFVTPPDHIKTSQGCGSLFLAPSPTTSGETSIQLTLVFNQLTDQSTFALNLSYSV